MHPVAKIVAAPKYARGTVKRSIIEATTAKSPRAVLGGTRNAAAVDGLRINPYAVRLLSLLPRHVPASTIGRQVRLHLDQTLVFHHDLLFGHRWGSDGGR